MPTHTIRKAQLEDLAIIVSFNVAMAKETEAKELEYSKISSGVRSLFDHPEFGFYLVAEHEGAIAGCLMVTMEWSDWRNGLFWWVQSVYVAPQYRNQGVYRALYEQVKISAKAEPQVCGCRLYVERENVSAQQAYVKLGMSETHYKMFEEMI